MKRKININREKVTPEEVAKRRDFNSLMKSYTVMKKPFWKHWSFIAGASSVIVAAIATVVYLQVSSPSADTPVKQDQTAVNNSPDLTYDHSPKEMGPPPLIHPPLKQVNVPYSSYQVNPSQSTELTYTTGSKIRIPKGAFKNEDGSAVTGNVDVRYREFHDPVDFFVSGISMTYDSAGRHFTFESAGMVEIYAYQHGKTLKMDPEKFIEIQMRSDIDGSAYNVYTMDTVANKGWLYLGKDKIVKEKPKQEDLLVQQKQGQVQLDNFKKEQDQLISQEQARAGQVQGELKQVQQEVKKIEDTKPVQPKKSDPKKQTFNMDVDAKEFPEIAVYKNVLFEVGDENKDFTPEMYKITWDDAVISEGKTKGSYIITLTKGREKHNVVTYPVFDGRNFDDAMKQYNTKFSEYTNKLSTRKEMEQKKQQEYDALVQQIKQQQEEYEQQVKELQKQQEELLQKQMTSMKTQDRIFRVFTISKFGVYNCDSPHLYPKGANVNAMFTDASGSPVKMSNVVYLVDRQKVALFTYAGNPVSNFEFNPGSKNIAWGVTLNNELAVAFDGEFESKPRSGNADFKVQIIPETELTSLSKIKSLLNIENDLK
jgi:hypothetical protein